MYEKPRRTIVYHLCFIFAFSLFSFSCYIEEGIFNLPLPERQPAMHAMHREITTGERAGGFSLGDYPPTCHYCTAICKYRNRAGWMRRGRKERKRGRRSSLHADLRVLERLGNQRLECFGIVDKQQPSCRLPCLTSPIRDGASRERGEENICGGASHGS